MNTTKQYRYSLDTSSKKFPCPDCRQKRLVRYVDRETGDYLSDDCGRCDREGRCGYHKKPAEYFTTAGKPIERKAYEQSPSIEIDTYNTMPLTFLERSMGLYEQSSFAAWLYRLFGTYTAEKTLQRYFVAGSTQYGGKGTIFWQIDSTGNLRTGKLFLYDSLTGKRDKEQPPYFLHTAKSLQPFTTKQCFFGEHLLTENPGQPVYVFEAEKTAIVSSIYFPHAVCIATGGSSGCKWREYSVFKVLKSRDVTLFPDAGLFNIKTGKTCFQEWSERVQSINERMNANMKVSRVLEDLIPAGSRSGQDIVDTLIDKESTEGLALIDGYPAIFDLERRTPDELTAIKANYLR